VDRVPDEQNRLPGRTDERHGLGDLIRARRLVDQAIGLRRQRRWHVELFLDHMGRILDVDRTRCSCECLTQALPDDLVGLVGVLDAGAVFDRGLEQAGLLDELDAAAANALLGDACALSAQEDDR